MDLVILGASGSIGTQTINVIKNNEKKWTLKGFSVGNKTFYVDEILKEFKDVNSICLKNKKDYLNYKNKYPSIKFFYGDKGLIKLIKYNKNATILNALVGFVGLKPSIVSLKLNRTLLLANKESLVCGGNLINKILKRKGKIYPIDSEHVAIAKCLYNENISDVNEIIITASGGPFFNLNREELKNVTLKDALNHPTWKMGNKITIDSATMMNKTFELIEAYYLFGIDFDKIKAIVNRKSLVHGLVKFNDGRIKLNVGENLMKYPILYALDLGKPNDDKFNDIELNTYDRYEFFNLSKKRFPLLNYAEKVVKSSKNEGVILNAINEECVQAFLNSKINFIDIENIIDKIFSSAVFIKCNNYKLLHLSNMYYRYKTRKEIFKR
ncbi:MAG: 1-deoxy-D-xylulose-5-phosphate reductoisomerase [Candidatus Onthovivens sp.]|nr:1-deoxy-D-xylulose-5-phosphate reductoisomerase [Mollicutes bacterium]MDY4936685.1 1-deoxy-D-xylulose-5-phosphate reductoisomerase [Candidatus Onthovivens sp.]